LNSYEEALAWIHSLLKFGIKPGLKRVEWLLKRTGNPEEKIKCIHIAGTNGKGSTVEYLRSIFNEGGYSIGTFTSPYLITFNERVSINGKPIKNDELLYYAKMLKPLVDDLSQSELGSPTEFEVITVISLLYFADKKPDLVIYETGLGGLFDSTNVITPFLSLITNIGYDHMGILGDTLEEIAFQKAGIIKKEIPLISTVEQQEAIEVIEERAKAMNSKTYLLRRNFYVQHKESTYSGETFYFKGFNSTTVRAEISMKGQHQIKNAALALAAVDYIREMGLYIIEPEKVKSGLFRAHWAGRFEKVSSFPDIILDGAHNLQGVQALKQTIEQHYRGRRIYLLFAALHDKAYGNMMKELVPTVDEAYFTTFDFPRAASAEELLDESPFEKSYSIYPWDKAINEITNKLKSDDVLIITGSLYFISEVRKHFKNQNNIYCNF
jgi:dihydrofolate synthase / folylpolyglutamate synthase